ncbi:MAG: 30S ribosomal protein S6 [Candidatus Zambryskibacteria bacterium]|nr:30S ribosomal protein S6 [Candidatus Zambryskibacteria bacterium]
MDENFNLKDENQIYEIGFHILPSIPEENLQLEISKLEDLITKKGGIIISQEFPKLRNLAYEIRKRFEIKYLNFNKAYFGWIKFEIFRGLITEIKKEIDVNSNILRFIIVKTVKENTIYTPKILNIPKSPVSLESQISKDENINKESSESSEISEEEIDKSIDELLEDENNKEKSD